MACCNYATQRKAIHDENWKLRNFLFYRIITLYPVKKEMSFF